MELGGIEIAILGKRHGLQYQRCGHAEEHRLSELLRGVQIRHTHFVSALTVIGKRYDLFKEVRGIGLLLGCVLTDRWKGQAKHVIDCCLEHGVMVLQAGPDVIRLAPSLVIETEEIDEGLARLAKAVKQLSREPVAM